MKKGDKVKCIKLDSGINIGDVYTVKEFVADDSDGIWSGDIIYIEENPAPYYASFFEVIKNGLSLEEEIELAKAYLDKFIRFNDPNPTNMRVTSVDVLLSKEHAKKRGMDTLFVMEEFEKSPSYVVVLSNTLQAIPLNWYLKNKINTRIEVQLNAEYKALVYKDKIVVGCQTFPIEILDSLFNAHESIC